jgi:hypothetical protein
VLDIFLNVSYRGFTMSDENHNVTVAQLKEYYRNEIDRRKSEIADFEKKLRLLEHFNEDTKLAMESGKKYHGWTLTPAVIDAVTMLFKGGLKNPDGLEAYDIYLYLGQMGFQGKKNLAIAVHTTLKRLAADGRIKVTQDKFSKRLYRPVE